jgi:hypothetical protein
MHRLDLYLILFLALAALTAYLVVWVVMDRRAAREESFEVTSDPFGEIDG